MRLEARIVGTLFIVGTAAGVVSVLLTVPASREPNYLDTIYTNQTEVTAGALLILVMACSLAMIPVVLFPILKEYNEALALGAVVFRGALEAVAYIALAVCSLLLVAVSRESMSAGPGDAASYQALGILLRNAQESSNHVLGIVFCLGALMIYWLFYASGLIPRWLSAWGLVGAVLYMAVSILGIFGLTQFGAFQVPLGVQEMVVALWLIVKGFNLHGRTPAAESTLKGRANHST